MGMFDAVHAILQEKERQIDNRERAAAYLKVWARSEFKRIANIDMESGSTGLALAVTIAMSALNELDSD